jgi:hypothetical protein
MACPLTGSVVIISFILSDAHLRALIARRSTCGCVVLAIRKGSRELFRHLDSAEQFATLRCQFPHSELLRRRYCARLLAGDPFCYYLVNISHPAPLLRRELRPKRRGRDVGEAGNNSHSFEHIFDSWWRIFTLLLVIPLLGEKR